MVGGRVKYKIRAQNDGDDPDKLIINSSQPSDGFKYKYRRGTKKISSTVLGPGYRTPLLQSGERHQIKLIVKAGPLTSGEVDLASISIDSLRDGDTVTDSVVAATEIN